jgi:hypothetical protein
MAKRRTRKAKKSDVEIWTDDCAKVHQKVTDAVSSLEGGNTNMTTMTKEKTVRIYDPHGGEFVTEQAIKDRAIKYAKNNDYDLETLQAEGFGDTLEEAAMSYVFQEAPRSEELIKSELNRLKNHKLTEEEILEGEEFNKGFIRGKIEILEAVLNNVEFESEAELWDKVWFGRTDRLQCPRGREPALKLIEQYGEEELMGWANNYSDPDYGWEF